MKCVLTGLLTTTKAVMCSPLPRVFEEGAQGKPTAVQTTPPGQPPPKIGGDFREEELTRVSKETVSAPLFHSFLSFLALH